jgi:prevent-host-death family protein
MRTVSATEAKAHLSALMEEVAHGGQPLIIERRGQPLVAMVRVQELAHPWAAPERSVCPAGALALVGAWSDVDDSEVDAVIEGIYRMRELGVGRQVEFGNDLPA